MTALGIDNYGRMTYRYGYEEIDFVDGTSDWVWNAPMHVFFLRLRELFDDELCALYNKLEGERAWSSDSLIKQFNDWQMQFPEELWRLDIERKYIRTYTDSFINGAAKPEFLKERANGRKKSQRSQFERNQEKYMSSKFGGTVASGDDLVLRCSVPNENLVIPANFDITLVPYSYVYLSVKYNTSPPERIRAVPGQSYTFRYTADLADIIEIYSVSCLKSIGDLSACYLINADFSNAKKIRELTLGNATEGYNNTNSITIGFGSNELLNKLDIQNMSGLSSELNVSGLRNLEELYAKGSSISGVVFADGGNLSIAEIPAVGSMSMKNLYLLDDEGFEITSYNNLTKLVAEYSELDLINLLNQASNLYQVRLIGVNWNLEDDSLLERLYNLAGVNNTGGNADYSVLSGHVYIPVIKQYDLLKYQERWSDLEIEAGTIRAQVPVYFKNYDGEILDTQYVLEGERPEDPVTSGRIGTPVRPSNAQYNYNYTGWDKSFTNVATGGTYIYTAQYEPVIRKYTVKYVQPAEFNISAPLQEFSNIEYGSYVSYTRPTPTYTVPEDAGAMTFYLFKGWDKTGYVDGDKVITAQYDKFTYTDGYFDALELNDMKPVEIYALTKLIERGQLSLSQNSDGSNYTGVEGTNIEPLDTFSFSMGHDVDIKGVESEVLISEPRTFSGTLNDYYDTGISLFDVDRSFVLAVDYEFASGNNNNATLMQCYNQGTSDGFRLRYSSNGYPTISWYDSSTKCASGTDREMLVIRHKAGEYGAHVYISNLSDVAAGYIDYSSTGIRIPSNNATLVFGCNKISNTMRESYAKGTIHWAKIWYDDLGDVTCKELASYIHETVETNLCGFNRYYISGSNNEKRPVFSFLGSKSLYSKKALDTDGSNVGGWATTDLNNWLNTRFYNGLPLWMKQLIKKVVVMSTPGGTNTSPLAKYDGYIYIPALADIVGGQDEAYENEIAPGKLISYINSPGDRIRLDHDGNAVEYWTRSPSLKHSTYFYYINTSGGTNAIGQVTSSVTRGVVVMFSI